MGGLGIGVRGMNERMQQLGGRLELASNGDWYDREGNGSSTESASS